MFPALQELIQPDRAYADLDLADLRKTRLDGHVLNLSDWQEQPPRVSSPRLVVLP
ncbi:MAG: hypothetical protein ACRBBS_09290 [Thalassovita sp.]